MQSDVSLGTPISPIYYISAAKNAIFIKSLFNQQIISKVEMKSVDSLGQADRTHILHNCHQNTNNYKPNFQNP